MISSIAALVGRVLIALIFVLSGANKLFTVGATNSMIVAQGLPENLAIPTALFEIIFGLAIMFGFMIRISALLLAGFTFVTIIFFHNNFNDPVQSIMALKNLSMIGGLLCLFAYGQQSWSFDRMRLRRDAEVADAQRRVAENELALREREHEAQLRTARSNATVHPNGI